jgi:hypothetical protein
MRAINSNRLLVTMLCSSRIRFRVDPREVPAEKAALSLGAMLLALLARGFLQPDPTTGRFDLFAIDQWMTVPFAPTTLTTEPKLRNAQQIFGECRASLGDISEC